LSSAMTLPADFGFKSCALTFFICELETRSRGGATPPSSVSCPTMRERTTRADCFARRAAFEGTEGFARPVGALEAAVGAAAAAAGSSCFSMVVGSGALDLRSSLKCPWKDQRRLVLGERVAAESGRPAAGGALDPLVWEIGGGSDVGGVEAPVGATGSPEGGSTAEVAGASVGFLPGASCALWVCDVVGLSRALMKSRRTMLRARE
jgi:hypothetical protein